MAKDVDVGIVFEDTSIGDSHKMDFDADNKTAQSICKLTDLVDQRFRFVKGRLHTIDHLTIVIGNFDSSRDEYC